MKRSCSIIAKVKDKDGRIVDSKLHKNLLSFMPNDRKDANRIYNITKSEEFLKNYGDRLTFDEYNEPTISSLLDNTNLGQYLTEEKLLYKLNLDIGHYRRGSTQPRLYLINDEQYNKLFAKIKEFNTTHEFRDRFVAEIHRTWSNEPPNGGIYHTIWIKRRNKLNSLNAEKEEYNHDLNEKIKDILKNWGVSIGALNELERRLGISGVTDFDMAKTVVDGLVELIRLADGVRGERALPEEFAHTAIEMLGDNPLISRLINYINEHGLAKEIIGEKYDEYSEIYKEDTYKLAKEAAGKLLAKHLLNNEEIGSKPYKNLLQRVIEAVKNFFRRLNASELQRAKYELDKQFGKLATDILSGNLDSEVSIDNIKSEDKLYQLAERVERDRKIVANIINNENKRLKIYEKRNRGNNFKEIQETFIRELENSIYSHKEVEGIYNYIDFALQELKKVRSRMKSFKQDSTATSRDKAILLRNIRNYLHSFNDTIRDIRTAMIEEESFADNRYNTRIREAVDGITTLLEDLEIQYKLESIELFKNFINPYLGENIEIPFGKYKGKLIKAEYLLMDTNDIPKTHPDRDLILELNKDIGFFNRWLDSMAEANNYTLKVMDAAVKKSKERGRLETISVLKRLQGAARKLEHSGITDQEWMFERDSDGKLTGNYISEINIGEYLKRKNEMMKHLEEKYGKNPKKEDQKKFIAERMEWFRNNLNSKGGIKEDIYGNSDFSNLSEAQREYYDEIMKIKKELDDKLPEHVTKLLRIIMIRKDLVDRLKSSDGVVSGTQQIWEAIKDNFIRRSDDADFGSETDSRVILDFEGREVMTLPVYYTRMRKGENIEDISTDITSTMAAYAAMANDYYEMNQIVDLLEVGRDLMRDKEVVVTKGGNTAIEKLTSSIGRVTESVQTKKKGESHLAGRIDSFFNMQIYQRYMKDEGTLGKSNVDAAKTANFINKLTSISALAGNVLQGVANVLTGEAMFKTEAISGEFFGYRNAVNGDGNYWTHILEFSAQIGSRIKTNKLALWCELFNVGQDYEDRIRDVDFNKRGIFSKLLSSNAVMFIQGAGEHFLHARTSLALADNFVMLDENGNKTTLWDAMEVAYLQEDGTYDTSNKTDLGAKLVVKEGYTKEDGTEFTQSDISKFTEKTSFINNTLHGIYNKADKAALQNLALGRMAFLFRKYIPPSVNKRFGKQEYILSTESFREGYYLTAGKFLLQLAKDLKRGEFNFIARKNELSKNEKANIKRALAEVVRFLIICGLLQFIKWDDDDDDNEDRDPSWWFKMFEYQLRRQKTEIGVLIPGRSMFNEGLKIIKSPMAGIKTVENTLDLIKLLYPGNYLDEIESGYYKGHSTAYKTFFNSPFVPIYRVARKAAHPEEAIPFYKHDIF